MENNYRVATPEEKREEKREILKKMILPLQVRVKERHRFTGTLESTDAAARLRDISAAIKAGGRHTGI